LFVIGLSETATNML